MIVFDTGLLGNYEEKATDEKTAKTEQTEEEIFEDEIIILTRFISVLGQVSANYILFLEGPVLNELKRRNQIDFERKMKKLNEKKNRSLKGRRNLENSTNERSNKIEVSKLLLRFYLSLCRELECLFFYISKKQERT